MSTTTLVFFPLEDNDYRYNGDIPAEELAHSFVPLLCANALNYFKIYLLWKWLTNTTGIVTGGFLQQQHSKKSDYCLISYRPDDFPRSDYPVYVNALTQQMGRLRTEGDKTCLRKGLLRLCCGVMVRGSERREQKRHIPQLALLFSFPACHAAPSAQESTRQTHTSTSVSAAHARQTGRVRVSSVLSRCNKNGQKALSTQQSTDCKAKCYDDTQNTHPQHALAFWIMLIETH